MQLHEHMFRTKYSLLQQNMSATCLACEMLLLNVVYCHYKALQYNVTLTLTSVQLHAVELTDPADGENCSITMMYVISIPSVCKTDKFVFCETTYI